MAHHSEVIAFISIITVPTAGVPSSTRSNPKTAADATSATNKIRAHGPLNPLSLFDELN